jgi:hypothetical protein
MATAEFHEGESAQTTPPLTLSSTGEVRAPAITMRAMGEGFFYFQYGRADSTEITSWPQAMDGVAPGTAEAAEIDGLSTSGKIGQDKTMPP